MVFNACENPCTETIENGHFRLAWAVLGDFANYDLLVTRPPLPSPPTLWVEWRFRSNHPIGRLFYTCDAWFTLDYARIHDLVFMYGNAAISFSGDGGVSGLGLDEFHTYRFESVDGVNYWISVDGAVFLVGSDAKVGPGDYLQMGGDGGCIGDQIPNARNEWDMVRYGTIGYSERIVAADPPAGYIEPLPHSAMDCFTVTFDSPNYVYIDDITVEVHGLPGPIVPMVTPTRRLDNGPSEVVEIVLNRPLPPGAATRFTFDDGTAVNVVDYTFIYGDADPDGLVDLDDIFCVLDGVPDLSACPYGDIFPRRGRPGSPGPDGLIDLEDVLAVLDAFAGI